MVLTSMIVQHVAKIYTSHPIIGLLEIFKFQFPIIYNIYHARTRVSLDFGSILYVMLTCLTLTKRQFQYDATALKYTIMRKLAYSTLLLGPKSQSPLAFYQIWTC